MSPLMFAANHLFFTKVATLIKAGAQLNMRDGAGFTVLMLAARDATPKETCGNNDEFLRILMAGETVEALIAAGAPVNARSNKGDTALSLAVKSGHGEIVKVLLANGADPKFVKGSQNRTLTMYTAQSGTESRVRLSKLLSIVQSK
jgi:ankyrin repeat protein